MIRRFRPVCSIAPSRATTTAAISAAPLIACLTSKTLGVTALWLTPWYDNANQLNQLEKYTADNQRSTKGVPSTDYHGYGAVDFYGVEEHFGDLPTLRELVKTRASARAQDHSGPGCQPYRALSPLGHEFAHAHLV